MAVPRSSSGRRRFVQLLGWAGVVAMARGGPALAAAAAAKSRTKPPPPPAPASPPPAAETPAISEEARALAEVVRHRHGQHLSAAELETIARDLDGDLRGARRMRDVKLANADEPDVTFHA